MCIVKLSLVFDRDRTVRSGRDAIRPAMVLIHRNIGLGAAGFLAASKGALRARGLVANLNNAIFGSGTASFTVQ